ncbi:hypothetical protein QFW80_03390 [Luteimonas sp. M1R5S18]|uniref:Uncharacterized protein n=1 Tax=Luteimonas rhizosphaericola TaxID=3042024 RepID=A0ABT6JFU9_9GAMM|nr:hypothetical protein [Luteimonas rhizosphaericola]MDH5829563.1 hypothetical protein [Luteimonas rhizosphaericola]
MHDDPVDFSQVRFRDTDVRHLPRREEAQGTPFWRIVGAVFVALCLYGLLQTLVTVAVVRHAVKDLERQLHALLSEPAPSAPAAPPAYHHAPAPRPATPPLPAYAGPVEARRAGHARACIGGFVSNRVEGGWSQTRRRCTATSE